MGCGMGCKHGSNLALLWLWHWLVATALIRPLAQETPCAMGVALKRQKTKKKKRAPADGRMLSVDWLNVEEVGNVKNHQFAAIILNFGSGMSH